MPSALCFLVCADFTIATCALLQELLLMGERVEPHELPDL
jgi:hypothetical protein